MRLIPAAAVTDCVRRLCLAANRRLPPEAEAALRRAAREEPWPAAAGTLDELCRNLDAARETGLPICQDTGLVTVFAELGGARGSRTLKRPCRRACAGATRRGTSARA